MEMRKRPFTLAVVLLVAAYALYSYAELFNTFARMPVYFQVLLLCNLGLWCWTCNVIILQSADIEISQLLGSHLKAPEHIDSWSLLSLSGCFSAVTAISIGLFNHIAWIWDKETAEIVPFLTFLLLLGALLLPWPVLFHKERFAFQK